MKKTCNGLRYTSTPALNWSLMGCLLGALLITGCSGQNETSSSTVTASSSTQPSSVQASSQPVASSSSQASSVAPVVDSFALEVNAMTVKQVQTNAPITVNTTPLNSASLNLVRTPGGAQ